MRNIVGQIATKEDFYKREREVFSLWKALDAGANIQLSAPRRVGKSSILHFLKDNPFEGYHFIYVEVESARSKDEFYRKIYREILKSESLTRQRKFWEQLKVAGNGFLKRLKGVSLGQIGSIEFNDVAEMDYEDELLNLLCGIDFGGAKLIIMIDEFPEVILNIVENNDGNEAIAKSFLQSNRAFRNHVGIQGKIQFIYTGSNSLNITVANLDASALINDLNAVAVHPLKESEARDLVRQVLANYGYEITDECLIYLIKKVEWLIPFYLQLMVQEIINLIIPTDIITSEIIDGAFVNILDQRNDHHFEHYVKRLKRLFAANELQFVNRFLCELAHNGSLTKNQALDIARGIIQEAQARRNILSLMHDGYLLRTADMADYKFNSPILQKWWQNHEC
jgi:uncharacterized protein